MRITINTNKIEALNPCADRLENWKQHYPKFKGDIVEFLDLDKITHNDKIWVAMRIMPHFLVEVFALDCAFSAYAAHAAADAYGAAYAAYADAAAAADHAAVAYAAYVAADAADAAAHAAADAYGAARESEQKRQIESIIYLVQKYKK